MPFFRSRSSIKSSLDRGEREGAKKEIGLHGCDAATEVSNNKR